MQHASVVPSDFPSFNLSAVDFRILGPLEGFRDGRSLLPRGPSQQALLLSLLLHANEVVSTSRLIDDVWGEHPPATAAKMVHIYVSELRKLLEPDVPAEAARVLVTRPPGYMLRIEPERLDANRFARLIREGRRALENARPADAVTILDEALTLWRGPPLAEFSDRPFARTEAARLEELRLTAVEDRIEAALSLGSDAGLVGELETLVAAHPLRETLRRQLMLALYRAGRQAEALDVYKKTRDLLVAELGIEPSRALHDLERAILRQDPSLDLPRPEAVAPPPADTDTTAAPAEPREVRKPVSVVVADLTSAGKQLDPEALRRVMPRVFAEASRALERHGGRTERIAGRGLMAVFGLPTVHEDDALRAVRAAVDMRAAVVGLNRELAHEWGVRLTVRAGVNTGEVVASERDIDVSPLVADEAVEAAVRLVELARPGEIVIGATTERLVRNAARAERLEESSAAPDAQAAWRLIGLNREAPAIARHADVAMVGREQELGELRRAFERTVRERTSYLCAVLGPAGIGKSRIVGELGASLEGRATVLSGRCLSYGEGITFWPLAEVVREAAGASSREAIAAVVAGEPDADLIAKRIAPAIGLTDGAGSNEETFWAARKFFEALARTQPLVVVFDDVHWAEPTFLDLVEHVVDWSSDAPILLLALARPELLEKRPLWAGGTARSTSIRIEPLSERESAELMETLLGETALPVDMHAQIARAAGGNPMFIEQMLAMINEEGVDPGAELAVPSSIQTLLAARLDRLDPEERAVLGQAAIVGVEFSRGAVADLAPAAARESIDVHLQALIRRELIAPSASAFPGEQGLRFRHVLIREAAYESVPKEVRAALHERVAAWIEESSDGGTAEYEEIIGHHFEQAYRYRADLGPIGEEQLQLATRGANRLAAAGRRASSRADMVAASSLLSRAASLLPSTDPAKRALLTDLGEVLRETGDFERGEAVLTEAIGAAESIGDRAVAAHARLIRLRLRMQVDPAVRPDDLIATAEEAISVFEALGDERRLARAWFNLAWGPWVKGSVAEAEKALERAIDVARRAGDERTAAQSINLLLGASLYGPTPVVEAVRRCEELLARPLEQRRITAAAYRALAGLRAMEGNFDEARRLARQDRAILEDLGLKVAAGMAAEEYGLVEILAGDDDAAERELRTGYEALEEIGETSILANVAAMLAQVLYSQKRDDEALRFSDISEEATARDDLVPQVQWRAARAKLLARAGDVDAAERLAREGVALAEETPDFLLLRADALLDLGEVLATTGDRAGAVEATEEALELYERKGNVVSAAAARERLTELEKDPESSPSR
jgi:predicted ATPase/DNA-binding SARP family transcriptional activator